MYIITNLELPCNTVLQSDFSLNVMLGVLHLFLQIYALPSPIQLCSGKLTFVDSIGGLPYSLPSSWVLKWRGIERLGCLFPRSLLARLWAGRVIISLPEAMGPATKPSWTATGVTVFR